MARLLYVACWLTPEQASAFHLQHGEEPEALHMTLLCVGDLDQLPGDAADTANEALCRWAQTTAPVDATVSGVGRFVGADRDCLYASVDAPALPAARQRLWEMLDRAGLTPDDTHGFTPHITLAYLPPNTTPPPLAAYLAGLPRPIRFATVRLCTPGGKGGAGIPLRGDTRPVAKSTYPQLVRAHVRGGSLDPGVTGELDRYFHSNPDQRACEAADHGYDPVTDPRRYLAEELAEPAHKSLRHSGPLTLTDVREWERQEAAEHNSHGAVVKDQPAASDVHVDTASGNIAVGYQTGRRKKPKRVTGDVEVVKADDEQRIVWGVVLEPDVEDSQGDVVSKEDVELAAHRFLYEQAPIGDQHRRLAPGSVRPVESYIAPCDLEIGGHQVLKGSWVLATHVPDDDLWEQVRKGAKAAYSVAGSGRRGPL